MTIEKPPIYFELVKKWQDLKNQEKIANENRLEVEREILLLVKDELKDKGTNNFPASLKITTGFNAEWSQEKIFEVYDNCIMGGLWLPFFPFDKQWKENNKKLSILKEDHLDLFNKYFADALTLKPKKPAFEIKK